MKVKLISYTCPSPELLEEGIDSIVSLISFCARVSNPSSQYNTETSERLISYLMKHKHWSPFEMVNVCLEIETTRDIARQLLRHRSFSFQEFSQRYADPVKELSFVTREARVQDVKNRQNSIELDPSVSESVELSLQWKMKQEELIEHAKDVYHWAIQNGIAKEQARCVLPEGNTVSRMYVNGTIRSWIHYIELRSENGTQKEHSEIARQCALVISKVCSLFDVE